MNYAGATQRREIFGKSGTRVMDMRPQVKPVSQFKAAGDKVLRKGIFLREYDEEGNLVAAGSEINPADYATQALYEAALTAAGHSLKPTWDWIRFVDTSSA